jgi:hypothetical protein
LHRQLNPSLLGLSSLRHCIVSLIPRCSASLLFSAATIYCQLTA